MGFRCTGRRRFRTCCVLFSIAAVSMAGSAQWSSHDLARIDSVVLSELDSAHTPGAVVGIIHAGTLMYVRAYGVANVETGEPMREEMLFRLGSTTKMMTAAGLVAASSRKLLDLHTPIGGIIPGLSSGLAVLTTHQLLSNSAGMADIVPPFVSNDDTALARMVDGWSDEVLFAPPGIVNSYSSAGFWLAGRVLERVTGMAYADAMRELVFSPLGMARSTLRPSVAMTYPFSQGHGVLNDHAVVLRPFYNNVAQWPAGSVFSDIQDLSRWVLTLLGTDTPKAASGFPSGVAAALFGRHVPIPGETDWHYGYGVMIGRERGELVMMHGGFSRGYGSMIQIFPDRKSAIIVLANRSGETLPRTREVILDRLLAGIIAPSTPPTSAPTLTAKDRRRFVGRYVNGPQEWRVIERSDSLVLIQQGVEMPLTPIGPQRLAYGDGLGLSLFFFPADGRPFEYLFDGLYSARRSPSPP